MLSSQMHNLSGNDTRSNKTVQDIGLRLSLHIGASMLVFRVSIVFLMSSIDVLFSSTFETILLPSSLGSLC